MIDFKIFVWDDVLGNYGPGLAVVCARSVEEARSTFIAAWEKNLRGHEISGSPEQVEAYITSERIKVLVDLAAEPEIHDIGPCAFWLEGSA